MTNRYIIVSEEKHAIISMEVSESLIKKQLTWTFGIQASASIWNSIVQMEHDSVIDRVNLMICGETITVQRSKYTVEDINRLYEEAFSRNLNAY